MKRLLVASVLVLICNSDTLAQVRSIILQSTTSTANSGLYREILPKFERDSGIRVHVVAVGTGQAIRNAENGDGDVLLVHAKEAELKFVADGYGVQRFDVMYNDFVIIGPPDDPAAIASLPSAAAALTKIAQTRAIFASRGDDSGTHKKELTLWGLANINPAPDSGKWYRETGSGMGATLNIGIEMNAYILSDRATWISFGNKRDHKVFIEGDIALLNQYGITAVNPAKHLRVKGSDAQAFIDWIIGPRGQAAIRQFRPGGTQLFFPNANH
ncbi:MAG: sulfate transporter [Rickettsiales bacterium]|nr:sulfate transporter [Rickettsiales bacterium]